MEAKKQEVGGGIGIALLSLSSSALRMEEPTVLHNTHVNTWSRSRTSHARIHGRTDPARNTWNAAAMRAKSGRAPREPRHPSRASARKLSWREMSLDFLSARGCVEPGVNFRPTSAQPNAVFVLESELCVKTSWGKSLARFAWRCAQR